MKSTIRQIIIFSLFMSASVSSVIGGTPSWQCWGPDLADPCRNSLNDVAFIPGTDRAVMAGTGGVILNWNGSSWELALRNPGTTYYGVAMFSPTAGWAVGKDGAMATWNGSRWIPAAAMTGDYIRAVEIVPGTNPVRAWAPADKYGIGMFHYFNGSFWEDKYNGSFQRFAGTVYGLSMLSGNDGWAVGTKLGDLGSGTTMIGQILRFDGSGWEAFLDLEDKLRAVDFSSANDGWAVGEEGAIHHWDGSSWVRFDPITDETLRQVAAVSATDAWIVGDSGTLLHWNGDQWSPVTSPTAYFNLTAVAVKSSGGGWIAGEGGVQARFNGAGWSCETKPTHSFLESVAVTPNTDGTDVWASGTGYTLLHWDGRRWAEVPVPEYSYGAVAMNSADDGWAAVRLGFARWDGYRWNRTPEASSASDLVMIDPANGWAVGWGTIQHWNGAAWTSVTSPSTKTFQGISAVAEDDIWAVGYGGTIVHYDGSEWSSVASPGEHTLQDVCMQSSNQGTIVGWNSGGLAYEWRGSSWQNANLPTGTSSLNAVDIRSIGGDVVGWIVGHDGQILRKLGIWWEEVESPTSNGLWDVAVVSADEAWAVGENGVILHWTDTPDPPMPNGAVISATAKLAGQAGTAWSTDFVVTNLGQTDSVVTVQAWLRDQANPEPMETTVDLQPMQSSAVEDVLGSLLGLPNSSAASLVLSSSEPMAAGSRTYNSTPQGTYGQSIPPISLSQAFAPGQVATLTGLVENSSFRSNLGLVNTTDTPIEVQVDFYAADGTEMGSMVYDVPAQGSTQRTRVLRDITTSRVDLAWAELRSRGGDFMAYISVVDSKTGDPVYQQASQAPSQVTELVLQGIAKVAGASGTNWSSALTLVNTAERTTSIILTLLIRGQANPDPESLTLSLGPGEGIVVDDVLQSLFEMQAGAASLAIRVLPGVVVSGRTFNQTTAGTYGQYIPSQGSASAVDQSTSGVFVGVIQNQRFRSNLGLTNATTAPAVVSLELFASGGTPVGAAQTIALAPGEVSQIGRVTELFTGAEIEGATLVVRVESGAVVQSFLSVIDSRTGDPVFQVPTTLKE